MIRTIAAGLAGSAMGLAILVTIAWLGHTPSKPKPPRAPLSNTVETFTTRCIDHLTDIGMTVEW